MKHKGKKKKKRTGLIIFLVIVFLLIIAGAAVSHFLYQKANSGLFFKETTLNGYDVSEKTAKEVLMTLTKDYSAPMTTIRELGDPVLTLTLKDMGYEIDEMKLLQEIRDCMTQQNLSLITSLFQGNNYEIGIPFAFQQETFENAVRAEKFSAPRVKSRDATLEYDEEKQQYYIEPEIFGNELDDADLRILVKDEIDQLVAGSRPGKDVTIDIPEALYFVPSIKSDDVEMNRKMKAWNQYCKAKITYTFGEEEKVVDWETIRNWIVMDGDEAYISEEDMYNFIYDLADQTDTLHYDRTFYTTSGRSIYFDGSDYGFQIDKDHEVEQLLADIQSNTETKREPVYAERGYSRNGRDDFNGYYVEVDLSAQHLYLYYEGGMVFDCPVVSGLPRNGRETATGVFTIPYKASPFRLTGGGAGGWDVDVQYWMPFHDGQGLHDASWRSNFGGSIYLTNGSHGCVNLPTYAAATIYSYIDSNYPIVLYK